MSTEEASARTLFIGDLSYFCNEDDIFDLFLNFGPVISVDLKRGRSGESLLHAFVEMSTRADAEEALKVLNTKKFKGRKMRINWADGANPPKSKESLVQLYVTFSANNNIPVTEEVLDNMFSQFGEVDDVQVKRSYYIPPVPKRPGYAFVFFCILEDAEKAIAAVNNAVIDDILYTCDFSHRTRDQLHDEPSSNSPPPPPSPAAPVQATQQQQQQQQPYQSPTAGLTRGVPAPGHMFANVPAQPVVSSGQHYANTVQASSAPIYQFPIAPNAFESVNGSFVRFIPISPNLSPNPYSHESPPQLQVYGDFSPDSRFIGQYNAMQMPHHHHFVTTHSQFGAPVATVNFSPGQPHQYAQYPRQYSYPAPLYASEVSLSPAPPPSVHISPSHSVLDRNRYEDSNNGIQSRHGTMQNSRGANQARRSRGQRFQPDRHNRNHQYHHASQSQQHFYSQQQHQQQQPQLQLQQAPLLQENQPRETRRQEKQQGKKKTIEQSVEVDIIASECDDDDPSTDHYDA